MAFMLAGEAATIKFKVARRILDSAGASLYMRERESYHHTRYLKRCDVVVDGFPRSANTYSWFALKSAIEPKFVVRGHTHSASTLASAIRDEKPAMLLVRDPDAAVSSLYQMLGNVSLAACFDAYSDFHERCMSVADTVFVARFEDVTADFGVVLDCFYRAYNLDWPRYYKTDENERYIYEVIEQSNRRRNRGVLREAGVARPSEDRSSKAEVLSALSAKESRSRLRAHSLYEEMIQLSE